MLKEFKKFALRGNIVDLAVGIIIGAAFTQVVKSLVDDILMKIIGIFLGKIDLSNLKLTVVKATATDPGLSITYGMFIQAIVNFLVVSFALFLIIKVINKLRKKDETVEETKSKKDEVILLEEIRDLLREK